MNSQLTIIQELVNGKCPFHISNFKTEPESKEYGASRFDINGLTFISRNAKITPKKAGQFVTFWKRKDNGAPIEPFHEKDAFDFYLVNIDGLHESGQFVFPKAVLVQKGIVSSNQKEGKRAFRVYPPCSKPNNKQGEKTQKWQLNYFLAIEATTDIKHLKELYIGVI